MRWWNRIIPSWATVGQRWEWNGSCRAGHNRMRRRRRQREAAARCRNKSRLEAPWGSKAGYDELGYRLGDGRNVIAHPHGVAMTKKTHVHLCLLYTSDAADE